MGRLVQVKEMSPKEVETEVANKLSSAGYTPHQINEIMPYMNKQARGKNVKLEPVLWLRDDDYHNAVVAINACINKPGEANQILSELSFDGPIKTLTETEIDKRISKLLVNRGYNKNEAKEMLRLAKTRFTISVNGKAAKRPKIEPVDTSNPLHKRIQDGDMLLLTRVLKQLAVTPTLDTYLDANLSYMSFKGPDRTIPVYAGLETVPRKTAPSKKSANVYKLVMGDKTILIDSPIKVKLEPGKTSYVSGSLTIDLNRALRYATAITITSRGKEVSDKEIEEFRTNFPKIVDKFAGRIKVTAIKKRA